MGRAGEEGLMPPKPRARVAPQGYIQVDIAEAPGCLARAEAWLRWAAGYGLAFGLGILAGLVLRGW